MTFIQSELVFQSGLYGNRSRRASKNRWVAGDFMRFPDDVPSQMGGWRQAPTIGDTVVGRARDMMAWRPNNQFGRYALIGTHSNVYLFDGSLVTDSTPIGLLPGREDTVLGAGYGSGPYGEEAYGTERTIAGVTMEATFWTFDIWGDVPIACYSYTGEIFDYELGADLVLQSLANAPLANAIAVSDERHVFAFSCDGDPSMVMWADRDDRTDWTPTVSNRAGFYQMQNTTPFQCGKRCRGLMLGFTRTELFGFSPLGNSLVYSRERIGSECGVMGPHAAVVITNEFGETAIWMSPHGFFGFDGLVRELPCDLYDDVFRDLNLDQRVKVQARTNKAFSEVWFFYCSAASSEIDRAVIYNYNKAIWYKATLSRLVWLDQGIFDLPLAIDADGVIFEHESGHLADGEPIGGYVLSHPLTVATGQQMLELAAFYPDLEASSEACEVSFITRDYMGGPDTIHGPYAFTIDDEKVDLAICARQAQVKIQGTAGRWELGLPLLDIQPGGGR